MTEKKQDFVVSDRRRFGDEGELRPDSAGAREEAEAEAAAKAASPPAATAPPPAEGAQGDGTTPGAGEEEAMPEAPAVEEQLEQHEAYKASGKKLDETYKLAWIRGLKTTYYLRAMGATHAEKSTSKAGALNAVPSDGGMASANSASTLDAAGASSEQPKFCAIDNPECEACQ